MEELEGAEGKTKGAATPETAPTSAVNSEPSDPNKPPDSTSVPLDAAKPPDTEHTDPSEPPEADDKLNVCLEPLQTTESPDVSESSQSTSNLVSVSVQTITPPGVSDSEHSKVPSETSEPAPVTDSKKVIKLSPSARPKKRPAPSPPSPRPVKPEQTQDNTSSREPETTASVDSNVPQVVSPPSAEKLDKFSSPVKSKAADSHTSPKAVPLPSSTDSPVGSDRETSSVHTNVTNPKESESKAENVVADVSLIRKCRRARSFTPSSSTDTNSATASNNYQETDETDGPETPTHGSADVMYTYGVSSSDLPKYSDLQLDMLSTSAPSAPSEEEVDERPRMSQVSVGVNLVKAARRLLKFLAVVDTYPALYKGPLVKAAIRRYECCWLPLMAKGSFEHAAAPPLDVHWVWLVHMLAPTHYYADCLAIAETHLPHRLMTFKALERARETGRALWESSYPEEAWDLPLDGSYTPSQADLQADTSKISYDLTSAIERQSAFFYQVSLPHYRTEAFLTTSRKRYVQFLALKKFHPDKFLVPAYDMDVMWHTHQVHPTVYKRDTEALLGQMLPHDDSVNDRSPGSRLVCSDGVTRGLWVKSYGTTFRREGAMFRCQPPSTYIEPVSSEVLSTAHYSAYNCQIVKLAIKGKAPDGPLNIKIKHETSKVAELSLFHDQKKEESEHNVTDLNLSFVLHNQNDWLVLKMYPKRRFSRFLKLFGTGDFWGQEYLHELFDIKTEGTVVKTFKDAGAVVEVTLNVVRTMMDAYVPLLVLTGPFMPTVLEPETLTKMQGIVVSNQDSSSDMFLAEFATHRLVNKANPKKPQVLEVEVYHSRHLMMSAVHLYVESASGRSLVALAHTLDANTLVSPAAVKCSSSDDMIKTVAMCDTSAGERAMIIKTCDGDWAIMIAAWEGLRRGCPGSASRRGVRGTPGHLKVRIHCPPDAPAIEVQLPYDEQLYSFSIQDISIDMQDGIFKVSGFSQDWIQNVALGLGVTVLHILCQPRFTFEGLGDGIDSVDGHPLKPIDPRSLPRRIPVERLKLLAALGFFCAAAPTNAAHRSKAARDTDESTAAYTGGATYITCAGACGSCGGCGGCGGGAYATFGTPDAGGWTGGHGAGTVSADAMMADGGTIEFLPYLYGPATVAGDYGGGDASACGGGDAGGCGGGGGGCGGGGGGCGGCGGCGG